MNKGNVIFKSHDILNKDTLTFFGKESNKIAFIINQRISNRITYSLRYRLSVKILNKNYMIF